MKTISNLAFNRATAFVVDMKNILKAGGEAAQQLPFSERVKAAIIANELKLGTAEEFFRKQFSATQSIVEMVKETDAKQDAVTSLDKGKLTSGKVLCITAIGFRYGYSTTNVSADSVRYSSAEYLNTFHTGIVNSEMKIKAGNDTIYDGTTERFLSNAFAELGNSDADENVVFLEQPKMVDSEQLFSIIHKFGAGSAATTGANFHYGAYKFYGAILTNRA